MHWEMDLGNVGRRMCVGQVAMGVSAGHVWVGVHEMRWGAPRGSELGGERSM